MKKKQIHFITGLPRCGGNLLSTLLNQHSLVWASSNSALLDSTVAVRKTIIDSDQVNFGIKTSWTQQTIWNFPQLFYKQVEEPVVFDKNPLWLCPDNFDLANKISHYPKFIVLHRPIIEVLTSYVSKAFEYPDFYLNKLLTENETADNRGDLLGKILLNNNMVIKSAIQNMNCLAKESNPQCLLIEYKKFVSQPQDIIEEVFDFVGIGKEEIIFDKLPDIFRHADSYLFGIEGFQSVRPEIVCTSKEPSKYFSSDFIKACEELVCY